MQWKDGCQYVTRRLLHYTELFGTDVHTIHQLLLTVKAPVASPTKGQHMGAIEHRQLFTMAPT